jgi:hypothetical protein
MTSETDKQIPGAGGKDQRAQDQRPHATLDLTATEIFPGGRRPEERETQADAASASEAPGIGAASAAGAAEHETALPPPYAVPPREEPGVGGFLSHVTAGLIGASLALIVGFFLFGNLRGALPVPGDPRTDELRGQLAAATQRIAALENAAKSAQGAAGGIDSRLKAATDQSGALKQEIGALAKRLGALESQSAGATPPSAESVQQSLEPLNGRLAGMEARIASLAKAQDELRATTGSAALAMAVQNLRRAVAEGRSFAGELKTLTALAQEPLEVAPLEARRDSGLPSLARLQRDFDASAKAAIAASRGPGDGTFTGDLLAKARGLVRVRPTGEVAGDTPEAILARAEHKLDAGDLPAALGEAGKLSGAAADAMTPWLVEAKAKAAADETLAKLESKLMTSLSTERAKDENAKRGG